MNRQVTHFPGIRRLHLWVFFRVWSTEIVCRLFFFEPIILVSVIDQNIFLPRLCQLIASLKQFNSDLFSPPIPQTYKPPSSQDIPQNFRTYLYDTGTGKGIFSSKVKDWNLSTVAPKLLNRLLFFPTGDRRAPIPDGILHHDGTQTGEKKAVFLPPRAKVHKKET